MKNLIMYVAYLVMLFVTSVTSAPSSPLPTTPRFYDLNDAPKLFQQFIKDNNREYKDEADKEIHYKAFVDNLKYINEENAKTSDYTLGITLFADLTPEESKKMFSHGCFIAPNDETATESK